jgi:outer membrane lipoprotein-sorting protein
MVILVVAGCASAAPADMKDKTLSAQTSVDDVLDALDLAGRDLKDFDADVTLTEEDTSGRTGSDLTRTGKVWFQLLPDGQARIHIVFDKSQSGNKIHENKLEYKLADGWLTERDYKSQKEVKRQVTKPGEKISLLKLGEGPFPLPIGQKKEDVKAVFDVAAKPVEEGDPAGTVHLELTPKADTSYARRFKSIDVFVDPRTHLPVRIGTLDKKGGTYRTTDLKNFKLNPGLKESDFELPAIKAGEWNLTSEEYHD